MAMSRILSQSLARASLAPSNALITHHRYRSTKPGRAHLIEVDLDSDSPDPSASEAVSLGVKRLQDAIHSIIVRRAAPDWLPFLPGHSYWVPPRAASARYTTEPTKTHQLLSEDEQMSLLSAQGWPSSTYFIEGTSPQHPIPMVVLSDTSSSKDEP
ncbi:hypothetical protein AAHA92_22629 [Salvia divinorum]|uniref:Uncharacterized protein n=1 Tax=Salvia divinorum TaxID=28513 RepID=A0ABD1GSA8_SALDI